MLSSNLERKKTEEQRGINSQIIITEEEGSASRFRTHTVDFFSAEISVTVTKNPSVVRKWISTTLYLRNRRHQFGRLVVGVGVQWNPSNGNDPPADTLQLCVGSRCLIFQLCHARTIPLILRRFLRDESNTFVRIWNAADAKKLYMEHELEIHGLLDLRRYVATEEGASLLRSPVETIVSECLGFDGVRLDNEISVSDWDDRYLSLAQVRQATVKAYVAFQIGKKERAWRF
ncbi:hypothetical protein DM860_000971 [Cuscuta australis]|uniref:3'-5' exonuclease domain-containing protein n=1 Tax=Cuscuta australis TaxID=267555 RepID=A0A328DWU3_9ASTE|nr:hypothetical protein DM860_000971 [Cuscuta australis]